MYTQTDAERYNLLTDVEPADEQLSALNKSLILHTLSEVIRKYGLENFIGIRLLHRHYGLRDGEIMLETEEFHPEHKKVLTTTATGLSGVKQQFAPNSWIHEADRFFPLEYSQDPAVAMAQDVQKVHNEFFKDFGAVLAEFGVTGLLGPCILCRDFFDTERLSAAGILVETSDGSRRASVVRFAEEGQYDWNKMIQTTWTAIDPKAVGRKSDLDGGHAAVLAMGCVPVTGCVKVGDGEHTSMAGHQ